MHPLMKRTAKTIAMTIPGIRRLVSRRDALLRERDLLMHQIDALRAALPRARSCRRALELTPDQLAEYQRRINELVWFHSIRFDERLTSKGSCHSGDLLIHLERLHLPSDLTGWTALDIGAWDGFYSFEMEDRGAARVLATDWFCWCGPGWGTKKPFLLARELLGSKVEDLDIDVMDLSPDRVGMFDLVLFSGMLYHMRDPIKALQNAASVVRKLLVVETAIGYEDMQEPVMGYVPRKDTHPLSNWWRPNPAAVTLWLQEMGFKQVEMVGIGGVEESRRAVFHARW